MNPTITPQQNNQTNPEAFKTLILSKYPNGVASDGTKYADMDATTLTQKIVSKFPDAVTSDGRKYADFLSPSQPVDKYADRNIIRNTTGDYLKGVAKTYADTPGKIASDVSAGASDIQKGMTEGEDFSPAGVANVVKGVAKSGLRVAGDAANAIFAPLSQGVGMVFDKLGLTPEHFEKTITKGSLVDELTNQKWFQDFATNHPNAGEDFNRALTLVMSSADATKMDPKTIVERTKAQIQNLTKPTAGPTGFETPPSEQNAPVNPQGKSVFGKTLQDMAIASEKKGWTKPTETPKASYNKATDIFKAAQERGNDVAETLLKNNVRLADNVEPNASGNKVFNTADTSTKLHADAAKMSNEVLRPSLIAADKTGTIPKTPVDDIINSAKERVNESRSLTSEAKKGILKKLDDSGSALKEDHPDGMDLTSMHDEKIVRDLNAKYSPVGDPAVNMEASKNKALADALRAEVEGKAPKDLPVKEFNAELTKLHQAAAYLDSLHGKPAPRTWWNNVTKLVAKTAGAGLGFETGGFMAGFGGYHLGGMIEGLLENAPASARNIFLKNLEVSNPEAFKKVQDYLRNNRSTKGSVAQQTSNKSKNLTIPQDNIKGAESQPMDEGTYKLRKNPATGRVEPTGDYRKPGINFYPPKKSNLGKDAPKTEAKKSNFGRKK